MEKHEGTDAGAIRLDDPWYDAIASGWCEPAHEFPPGSAHTASPRPRPESAADVSPAVQHGPAFREVRSRYRRYVIPASVAFLTWYFAYVIAATAVPGLMARPVAGGPLNVAIVAGLAQFTTTFLLTFAYAARQTRLRRDRAALGLRRETWEMTRDQMRERPWEQGR
ncbi:DUF485 domain-containing protein [Streptomyces sp. NPDC047108]|uniref:DUF485 domain-containing protein n=1 Tax=Streptomyces sp. NPDC047108 TaxID=3155025 RepID=UPI0033C0B2F1